MCLFVKITKSLKIKAHCFAFRICLNRQINRCIFTSVNMQLFYTWDNRKTVNFRKNQLSFSVNYSNLQPSDELPRLNHSSQIENDTRPHKHPFEPTAPHGFLVLQYYRPEALKSNPHYES